LRDAFAHYTSPFILLDAVLSWGTSKFGAVPVTHEPRRRGQSNYTIAMLLNHAGNMMTAFSAVPLRLASLTGFAFAAFGLCVLIYVVARFVVEGGSVPGFPFLASIISIFSGAQLFAIGEPHCLCLCSLRALCSHLCRCTVCSRRRQRTGIPFSRLDHFDLLRSPVVCDWHIGGISCANAFPSDGQTTVCHIRLCRI
jgi:hypothetical protein